MRVDRLKNFISEEERLEILEWFEKSLESGVNMFEGLSRGVWGYKLRKTSRQNKELKYPEVINNMYKRIIASYTFTKGCHKEILPCGCGFIAVTTYPEGDTYKHIDPSNCNDGMSVIRFNILIQKADVGGDLVLYNNGSEKVIDVQEKELYACNLSDYWHSVTKVTGSKNRHILLFSICCPKDDWENGIISIKK